MATENLERKYMERAIELAKKAEGYTSPNPLVGAVIVKDGTIIGEGYHEKCGQLHAERNAIKALTQEFFAGIGANQSYLKKTVFVVGDRKQSIYSFQGADPDEFDRMFYHFQSKDSNFKKIKLIEEVKLTSPFISSSFVI